MSPRHRWCPRAIAGVPAPSLLLLRRRYCPCAIAAAAPAQSLLSLHRRYCPCAVAAALPPSMLSWRCHCCPGAVAAAAPPHLLLLLLPRLVVIVDCVVVGCRSWSWPSVIAVVGRRRHRQSSVIAIIVIVTLLAARATPPMAKGAASVEPASGAEKAPHRKTRGRH